MPLPPLLLFCRLPEIPRHEIEEISVAAAAATTTTVFPTTAAAGWPSWMWILSDSDAALNYTEG